MVGRDTGASALFLLSGLAVWGWFWWCTRPPQLEKMVEAREGLRFLARKGADRDRVYLRRAGRYVAMPAATVLVVVGIVELVRAVVG